MFDTGYDSRRAILENINLSGLSIKRIKCRARENDGMVSSLSFADDNGSSVEAYQRNWNCGQEMTYDIPQNHKIVGLYGSL